MNLPIYDCSKHALLYYENTATNWLNEDTLWRTVGATSWLIENTLWTVGTSITYAYILQYFQHQNKDILWKLVIICSCDTRQPISHSVIHFKFYDIWLESCSRHIPFFWSSQSKFKEAESFALFSLCFTSPQTLVNSVQGMWTL